MIIKRTFVFFCLIDSLINKMSLLDNQCVCCKKVKNATFVLDCFHHYCMDCLDELVAQNEFDDIQCKDCGTKFSSFIAPSLLLPNFEHLPLEELKGNVQIMTEDLEKARARRVIYTNNEKKNLDLIAEIDKRTDEITVPLSEMKKNGTKKYFDIIKKEYLDQNPHDTEILDLFTKFDNSQADLFEIIACIKTKADKYKKQLNDHLEALKKREKSFIQAIHNLTLTIHLLNEYIKNRS